MQRNYMERNLVRAGQEKAHLLVNFHSSLPPLFPSRKTEPYTFFSASHLFNGFSPPSCWQMNHGFLLIFINLVVIQTY